MHLRQLWEAKESGAHGRRLLRCRVSTCSLLWATMRRPGGISELALLSSQREPRTNQPSKKRMFSGGLSLFLTAKKPGIELHPRTSGLWMSNEGSLAVLAVYLGYLL